MVGGNNANLLLPPSTSAGEGAPPSSADADADASSSSAIALEVARLAQENEALVARLAAAEADAAVHADAAAAAAGLSARGRSSEGGEAGEDDDDDDERSPSPPGSSSALLAGGGHSNPRQKLHYHLRQKQELVELRAEATALLRDRFALEQCVRFLAARVLGADSARAAASLPPSSLAGSPSMGLTPGSKDAAARAGRGAYALSSSSAVGVGGRAVGSSKKAVAHPNREALAASLAAAKASASEALRALVSDLESAKENGKGSSSFSPSGAVNVGAVSASVEVRILEKIMSVCEPASAGAGAASAAAAAAAEKGAVGGGNDGTRRTAV